MRPLQGKRSKEEIADDQNDVAPLLRIIVAVLFAPVARSGGEQPIIHGAMIRQTKVEGFSLHYHLLS